MSSKPYVYLRCEKLVHWAGILLLLWSVLSTAVAITLYFDLRFLDRLSNDLSVPPADLAACNMSRMLLGYVKLVCLIAVAFVFLNLLGRLNHNARALGAWRMKFTPGWCIGWFFIPIVNLFRPYQATKEIWQASVPDSGRDDWRSQPVSLLVGFWWLLWVVYQVLGFATWPFLIGVLSEAPIEKRIFTAQFALGAQLVSALLAIVARAMLVSLFSMQEEKLAVNESLREETGGTGCPNCGESLFAEDEACPMCGESLLNFAPGSA